FFFFSSRRRHTRSKRDWSSDVCSSDLARLSACCSRRSTPKSSARIGSSNGCGANSAEGWVLGIAVSEAKVNYSRGREIVAGALRDRKSTRLNSSHVSISYAVFCLKKKK